MTCTMRALRWKSGKSVPMVLSTRALSGLDRLFSRTGSTLTHKSTGMESFRNSSARKLASTLMVCGMT